MGTLRNIGGIFRSSGKVNGLTSKGSSQNNTNIVKIYFPVYLHKQSPVPT